MTPLRLQYALKMKLEGIVKTKKLSSPEGTEKHIQVFEQHLPRKVKSQTRNPESTFYPCIIVYLEEGSSERVKVLFIIGTHDVSDENQGYKDAMNIAEQISQELTREPLINQKYELAESPKWFYSDQDNYPYYFTWIETYWEIPRALRDDVEGMI